MRRSTTRLALVVAVIAVSLPVIINLVASAHEAITQAGFVEDTVFSGLNNPTTMRFSPDGRVFVAEKSGLIKVFDSLSDPTPTVFADLRTNVHNFWDRGVLGLALHPNFPATPYVYVLYTYDAPIGGTAPRWGTAGATSDPCPTPPGATDDGCVVSGRLSRLTAAGDTMTGPEQVLIEDWCQQYPSHSVGSLAFGADGMLYVTGGDGASFFFLDFGQEGNPVNPCNDPGGASPAPPSAEGGSLRAQDIRTTGDPVGLNGSLLRVDPLTGAGLPDNPLGSSSDANARRIVATGFRNPFRIAARPGTNQIWVGDVGADRSEEIDVVDHPADGTIDNFGWPCYEGDQRQPGWDAADMTLCENLYTSGAAQNPFFKYQHTDRVVPDESCEPGSSAIAGLAFAPASGGNYPADFANAAFFADNSRDCIWVMKAGPSGPLTDLVSTFVADAESPVDLQIGPDGMLYYVDFDGGTIRRVRFVGDTLAPTVSSLTPGQGATGVALDANITAAFSEPMDPSTVNASTVGLRQGSAAGPVVSASVTYNASARTATLDPGSTLTADTTYFTVVSGGASGAKDVAGNPLAADASWSFTTGSATSSTRFLSDLPFVGTPTNGWGPIERDHSNGEKGPDDGAPLRINTETFAKGLGTHAASEAHFIVPTECTRLQAQVGVDQETGDLGTVTFQVFAGTTQLGTTVTRNGTQGSAPIDLDVTGRNEIRLVVDGGSDGVNYDHGDWADAKLLCSGDTLAPTTTAFAPGAGATGVAQGANITATFSEAMDSSTLNPLTVALHAGNASGPVVATTVNYDATSHTVTLDPTAPLTADSTYTTVITGGASGAKDVAGNPLAADASWSFTTGSPTSSTRYLSDLPFVGTPTNGWGAIERDHSNGEKAPDDGAPLRINTETFAKGLGTHAASEARFAVPAECTRLQAQVGVDQEMGDLGTVTFQVFAGTTQLGTTVTRNGTQASAPIDLDVTGRNEIRLVVGSGSDGINHDHADWADAKLLCSVDTVAPTVTSVTPDPGAAGLPLEANVSATFSEAIDPSTLNPQTVALHSGSRTGPVVATTMNYDATNHTVTLDPTAPLTPNTTYSAVIVRGSPGVQDVAGNPLDATTSWSFVTGDVSTSTRYLSDLPFVGTPSNGWGAIERDHSNGEKAPDDGAPLRINAETFAKGLGTHAASEARFAVPADCTRFQAQVGVDQEMGDLGTVTFQVFAGTTQLGTTIARNGTQASVPIDLDVTGRNEIRLVVGSGSDGINHDHADWADAKFQCTTLVNTPPTPVILTPTFPTAWKVGDAITFTGAATDTHDGALSPSALSWSIVLQHCPSNCHTHPLQSFTGVASGSFVAPDHAFPSYLELRLTATDSSGLTTTVSRRLDPMTVALTFASSTPGLQLVVDGTTTTTPFSTTVIVGSEHTVTATSPQTLGATTFEWVSWSDGLGRTHQIHAPPSPTTLTALFQQLAP